MNMRIVGAKRSKQSKANSKLVAVHTSSRETNLRVRKRSISQVRPLLQG